MNIKIQAGQVWKHKADGKLYLVDRTGGSGSFHLKHQHADGAWCDLGWFDEGDMSSQLYTLVKGPGTPDSSENCL